MTNPYLIVVCQGINCDKVFRISDNLGNFDREPAGVCCYHCRKYFCKECAEQHFGTFAEQPMAKCRLEAIEWLKGQESEHAKVALVILEKCWVRK